MMMRREDSRLLKSGSDDPTPPGAGALLGVVGRANTCGPPTPETTRGYKWTVVWAWIG